MMDGHSVAKWIDQFRFTPTWGRAYDMGDVDRFLDELAAAARRDEHLGDLVAGKQFRTVALRQGYSQREVDEFLAKVATAVLAPSGPDSEDASTDPRYKLIEDVRFTPTRLRDGYEMDDVDALLDQLQAALRMGEPLGPIAGEARLRTTKLREGYDRVEVDEFLLAMAGPAHPGSAAAPSIASPPAHTPAEGAGAVVQEQKGLLARLLGR
jgi:DivIVA domain-containing protein